MTPCPKPRPRLIDKRERAADLAKIDRAESAKVKRRSGGRCEVCTEILVPDIAGLAPWRSKPFRCDHRAAPGNHHLIGGIGRKNRGVSILAEHRLAVCQRCHDDITGHVLQLIGTPAQREAAATVVYERVR